MQSPTISSQTFSSISLTREVIFLIHLLFCFRVHKRFSMRQFSSYSIRNKFCQVSVLARNSWELLWSLSASKTFRKGLFSGSISITSSLKDLISTSRDIQPASDCEFVMWHFLTVDFINAIHSLKLDLGCLKEPSLHEKTTQWERTPVSKAARP
jgi:hypothetical protein